MRDYYAVLGVNEHATAEEVLAAWRTRSAVLHPDRFDPVTQAGQWQQANAMFAELREAHEILADARRRAEYDLQRGGGARPARDAPPAPHVRRPERPAPSANRQRADRVSAVDPPLLASRFVEAGALPAAALQSLSRTKDSDALFRCTNSGFAHAVGLGIGIAGCALTWQAARSAQFDSAAQLRALAGLAGAWWLTLFNALRLWLARATPFGRGLVVTPYYFAEVRWDRARLTPLIALKHVAMTHHRILGVYAKTTFHTEWASRALTFDVAHKADSEQLSRVLVESANRVRQSFAYGQGEAIVKRFAFAQSIESLPNEEFTSGRIRMLERLLPAVAGVATVIALAVLKTLG